MSNKGNRFELNHSRDLGYSERQFEKLLEKEQERQLLPKDPKERKRIKDEMRQLEEKYRTQVSHDAPTEKQIKCYNFLLKKCNKLHIAIKIKKPNSKSDYSSAIDYLDTALKSNQGNVNTPTVKLYDKGKLLSLFDKMTVEQREQIIAYAERMLSDKTQKAKHTKTTRTTET